MKLPNEKGKSVSNASSQVERSTSNTRSKGVYNDRGDLQLGHLFLDSSGDHLYHNRNTHERNYTEFGGGGGGEQMRKHGNQHQLLPTLSNSVQEKFEQKQHHHPRSSNLKKQRSVEDTRSEKKISSIVSTTSSVLTTSDYDKKSFSTIGSISTTTSVQKHVDTPIKQLYEVRNRLGKGAYGIVWEAIERDTGRQVALKKIFDAFRNDMDAQRTYREIMFLRVFGHHPHIISLTNIHRAANNLDIYLVFPFMENDLHKLIKYSPELLSVEAIRKIAYQFMKALLFLHSADVIHRDLKPANILLDASLNVKLGDFGLARSLVDPANYTDDTRNEILTDYIATRWYRPPEILLSCKMYTKGVDMWAVGCILGEMILLRPLFSGGTTMEMLQTIMGTIEEPTNEEIEDMCKSSGIPEMNATIVEKTMEFRRCSLEDLLENRDSETVQIMEQLLVFNPNKRLDVYQVIAHPFFSRCRNPDEEECNDHTIQPPVRDNVKLKVECYRDTLYDLIKHDSISALYSDSDSTTKASPSISTTASEASSANRNSTTYSNSKSDRDTSSTKSIVKKRTIFTLPSNNQSRDNWMNGEKDADAALENAFKVPARKPVNKTHSLTSISRIWNKELTSDENDCEFPEVDQNFRDVVKKYQGGSRNNYNNSSDASQIKNELLTKKQQPSSWAQAEKFRPPTAPYIGNQTRIYSTVDEVSRQNSSHGTSKAKYTSSVHSILDGLPYLSNVKMAPPPPSNYDSSYKKTPPNYDNYQTQKNRHNYTGNNKIYNNYSLTKAKAENMRQINSKGTKMYVGNHLENITTTKPMFRIGDMQQKLGTKMGYVDNSGSSHSHSRGNSSLNYGNNLRLPIQKKQVSTKPPNAKHFQATRNRTPEIIDDSNRRDPSGRSAYFPDSIIKVNPLSTNPDNRNYQVNKEFRIPKPPQRGYHHQSSMSMMNNPKCHLDKYSHIPHSQTEATINASELYQLTNLSYSKKGKYGGTNL